MENTSQATDLTHYALEGLALPEHLQQLLDELPPTAEGTDDVTGLRAFIDRGVERAVWDNGAYLESLRWETARGEWVEEYPAELDLPPETGEAVRNWDETTTALYKRACDSIQGPGAWTGSVAASVRVTWRRITMPELKEVDPAAHDALAAIAIEDNKVVIEVQRDERGRLSAVLGTTLHRGTDTGMEWLEF